MYVLALCISLAGAPQWLGKPPQTVRHIVSLAPSLTELLYALGAGDQVVGVTRHDDYPPAVNKLPRVGGFIDPDPEAILALHPDLVVGVPTSGGRGRVDTLVRLGVPVLILPAESLADLWLTLEALGEALNRRTAATALKTQIQSELREACSAPPSAIQGVLVAVGVRPLVVAGPGSFMTDILPFAGAVNVVQRGKSYPIMDLEAVHALDPDAVVDLSGEPRFFQAATFLRAVRDAHVVQLEPSVLSRAGPRLPRAVRQMCDLLWKKPAP